MVIFCSFGMRTDCSRSHEHMYRESSSTCCIYLVSHKGQKQPRSQIAEKLLAMVYDKRLQSCRLAMILSNINSLV